MTWVVWNIRGINMSHKQKTVRKLVKKKEAELFALLETRVKAKYFAKIFRNTFEGCQYLKNYYHAIN